MTQPMLTVPTSRGPSGSSRRSVVPSVSLSLGQDEESHLGLHARDSPASTPPASPLLQRGREKFINSNLFGVLESPTSVVNQSQHNSRPPPFRSKSVNGEFDVLMDVEMPTRTYSETHERASQHSENRASPDSNVVGDTSCSCILPASNVVATVINPIGSSDAISTNPFLKNNRPDTSSTLLWTYSRQETTGHAADEARRELPSRAINSLGMEDAV